MKKDVHPKYQKVLFVDSSTGHKFLCGSTLVTKESDTFEGKTYPVYRASISSASHPFFTGSKQLVDAEGRVDKFKKRYINAQQKKSDTEGESVSKEEQAKKDEAAKKDKTKKK